MATIINLIIIIMFTSAYIFCDYDLVDRKCLDCFCQAQSDCDISFTCDNSSLFLCGPYKLSYAYWIDGQKLGNSYSDSEFDNYVQCSKNMTCAEQTIQNYMKVYAINKDCNGNDKVDCVDYFRIHLGGPGGCTGNGFEKTYEWLKFLECYLNSASNVREALYSTGIRKNI